VVQSAAEEVMLKVEPCAKATTKATRAGKEDRHCADISGRKDQDHARFTSSPLSRDAYRQAAIACTTKLMELDRSAQNNNDQ
jgi:hypothetical protein